jgi:hypothetical protein
MTTHNPKVTRCHSLIHSFISGHKMHPINPFPHSSLPPLLCLITIRCPPSTPPNPWLRGKHSPRATFPFFPYFHASMSLVHIVRQLEDRIFRTVPRYNIDSRSGSPVALYRNKLVWTLYVVVRKEARGVPHLLTSR